MSLRPGEVVLREATRSFSVRADQARTLKGLLVGRRAAGPAPVPALQGVSLHVEPGETVGMVGRNGAGKTSTLRVLAGIVPLESGVAECGGRVVSLLELAAGFSRDFSGRENILLQGALYGFSRLELEERMDRIIAFSELAEFIDIPVKTYSSGMYVRLGFSIAAHLSADVLLIDEVLAVGDEAFQRKCLRRISEQIAAGATLVLVSHDPASVERVCERVVVLDGGRIVFDGPTAEGLLRYHQLMGTEHGSSEMMRAKRDDALRVLEMELQDGEGRRSSVFRSGGAFRVAATVQALRELRSPELRLELRAGSGTLLFSTTTALELEAPGQVQVSFDIPELLLLGGDYDLSLGVRHTGGALQLQRTAHFAVPHQSEPQGLVDLRGAWATVAAAGGARG